MVLLQNGPPPTASHQRVLGEQETKERMPGGRGPTSDPSSASTVSPALLTRHNVDVAQEPSLAPGSAGCSSFPSSSVTLQPHTSFVVPVASEKVKVRRNWERFHSLYTKGQPLFSICGGCIAMGRVLFPAHSCIKKFFWKLAQLKHCYSS